MEASNQNTQSKNQTQGLVFTLVLNEAKVIHQISLDSFAVQRLEVQRWRDILAVPYANYKSMLVPR